MVQRDDVERLQTAVHTRHPNESWRKQFCKDESSKKQTNKKILLKLYKKCLLEFIHHCECLWPPCFFCLCKIQYYCTTLRLALSPVLPWCPPPLPCRSDCASVEWGFSPSSLTTASCWANWMKTQSSTPATVSVATNKRALDTIIHRQLSFDDCD